MITNEQLDEFLPMAQATVDASYDQFMPKPRNIDGPVLSIEKGRRYARIIATSHGDHRGAWGFIELSSGNLLKANGWKNPAKNFARGNILNPDRGLLNQKWTGVA